MTPALVVALVAAQTVNPVKIVNPSNQSQALGNAANPLAVTCVSGCGGAGGAGGTGGTVDQGVSNDGGYAWHVDVQSSVLPTGAATSAKQDTGNTSLASIDTVLALIKAKTDNIDVALSTRTKPADQQHVIVDSSASVAVTNANLDAALSTLLTSSTFTGRFAAAAALADNTSNPSLSTIATYLMLYDGSTWDRAPGTSVDGMLVNLGANNDVTVTSGTVTANQGTSASSANRWKMQLTDGTDDALVSAAGALAVDSTQLPAALVGGRLDENVGAWLGSTAPTVGQKTMANSIPVVISSDQSSLTVGTHAVTQSGAPWTMTPPTGSVSVDGACVSVAASTTVLASNASRRQASLCARVSNSDTVYMKLAATATTSDFPLEPGQCFNLTAPGSIYTGVIDAIAGSGTQSVCVVEVN